MKIIMNTIIIKKLFYPLAVLFTSTILSGVLIAESNAASEDGPKLSLCDGVWTTKSCEKPEKSFQGVDRPVSEKKEEKVVEPKVEEKKDAESVEGEEGTTESETKDESEGQAKLNGANEKIDPIEPVVNVEQTILDPKIIAATLHPLIMKTISIREKFGKDFDYKQVERYCESEDAKFEDCEAKVSDSLEKARAYEIKLQELALEERQLETEVAKNQPKLEQNSVAITQVTSTTVLTNNVNKVEIKQPHPGLGKHRDIIVSRPNKEVRQNVGSSLNQSAVVRN